VPEDEEVNDADAQNDDDEEPEEPSDEQNE